jgi:hypothetical protein
MHFRTLAFLVLLISSFSYAQGRKPAVEDFVGIEIEHPTEDSPQGTESLFNFEKDMTRYVAEKDQPSKAKISQGTQETATWGLGTIFGLTVAILLPLVSWLTVMNHLRRKAHVESASNIEILEKYRKEREQSRKTQEDIRKAS